MKLLTVSVILILSAFVLNAQKTFNEVSDGKVYCKDQDGNVLTTLTTDEVFAARTPSLQDVVGNSALSNACQQQIGDLLDGFTDAEYNGKEEIRIVNQACSYAAGWMEKVPGTCDAGGPPPICPDDHWIQVPNARQRWTQLQKDKYNERLKKTQFIAQNCNIKDPPNDQGAANAVAVGGQDADAGYAADQDSIPPPIEAGSDGGNSTIQRISGCDDIASGGSFVLYSDDLGVTYTCNLRTLSCSDCQSTNGAYAANHYYASLVIKNNTPNMIYVTQLSATFEGSGCDPAPSDCGLSGSASSNSASFSGPEAGMMLILPYGTSTKSMQFWRSCAYPNGPDWTFNYFPGNPVFDVINPLLQQAICRREIYHMHSRDPRPATNIRSRQIIAHGGHDPRGGHDPHGGQDTRAMHDPHSGPGQHSRPAPHPAQIHPTNSHPTANHNSNADHNTTGNHNTPNSDHNTTANHNGPNAEHNTTTNHNNPGNHPAGPNATTQHSGNPNNAASHPTATNNTSHPTAPATANHSTIQNPNANHSSTTPNNSLISKPTANSTSNTHSTTTGSNNNNAGTHSTLTSVPKPKPANSNTATNNSVNNNHNSTSSYTGNNTNVANRSNNNTSSGYTSSYTSTSSNTSTNTNHQSGAASVRNEHQAPPHTYTPKTGTPTTNNSYTAPATHNSYTAPATHNSYTAPATHSSYTAPATHNSYTAPSHSSYTAPSHTYTAPAHTYTAPAHTYTAPSYTKTH